jgi:hypothetical protein
MRYTFTFLLFLAGFALAVLATNSKEELLEKASVVLNNDEDEKLAMNCTFLQSNLRTQIQYSQSTLSEKTWNELQLCNKAGWAIPEKKVAADQYSITFNTVSHKVLEELCVSNEAYKTVNKTDLFKEHEVHFDPYNIEVVPTAEDEAICKVTGRFSVKNKDGGYRDDNHVIGLRIGLINGAVRAMVIGEDEATKRIQEHKSKKTL